MRSIVNLLLLSVLGIVESIIADWLKDRLEAWWKKRHLDK